MTLLWARWIWLDFKGPTCVKDPEIQFQFNVQEIKSRMRRDKMKVVSGEKREDVV